MYFWVGVYTRSKLKEKGEDTDEHRREPDYLREYLCSCEPQVCLVFIFLTLEGKGEVRANVICEETSSVKQPESRTLTLLSFPPPGSVCVLQSCGVLQAPCQ